MKKLFMLFAMMSLVAVASVDAQTCSKSTKASCSKTAAECTAAAAKMASLDANIEKRTCEESGKISFVRKSVCSVSGKTSYTNVEYNADTKKFVNVSPTHTSGVTAKGKACAKKGAACCAGKAKATSASASASTKAACSKGEKSACCAKGKNAKSASTTAPVKKTATAVKTSN